MPYPSVTVLIPAYNAGHTIERALASVWRQNYPEMEVVVVDDGSSDDTAARVEQFRRPGLRLIRLENNRGECGAMNAGIAQARTDYVAFLDADDEWLDDKLVKQLPIIDARPPMSLIYCGGESMDPEGRVYSTFGMEPPPYSADQIWRGLLVRSYVIKSTAVARRAKLLEVGGFDEALAVSGDQDMWIKLASIGEVGFVTELLARKHEEPYSLMKRYGTREDEFGVPMIRSNLSRLAPRLSKQEMRQILGQRYAGMGRNIYSEGCSGRGAALIIRAMLLGNRPLQNLAYLVSGSPTINRFKRRFLRRKQSQCYP